MKILVLSWNYPPTIGGIEYVAGNLVAGLLDQGHAVTVLTRQVEETSEGPEVRRATRPGLVGYLRFAWSEGRRCCREDRPDLVVCGSVVPGPAAWLLRRVYGCPYLVLVHGSDILQENWFVQRVFRFLYRGAARLTANSEGTRDLLVNAGIPAERIDVVFPGVRTGDFDREPETGAETWIETLGDRPLLLSVGRLIRRKGLLEFVEQVMPRLVEQTPELALVIVGGDATASLVHSEKMADQIQAAIDRAGLGEHVWLAGKLPDADVVRLYFRSRVFIMPCLNIPGDVEGFGIVFLEAALAGSPSVATRVGGIPDAVVDGETGILTEPEDWDGLTNAVTSLLQDETLRQRLARQGRERALASFSWTAITAMYEAAFHRTCGTTETSRGS